MTEGAGIIAFSFFRCPPSTLSVYTYVPRLAVLCHPCRVRQLQQLPKPASLQFKRYLTSLSSAPDTIVIGDVAVNGPMGHTACCTPFTTTYLGLSLRQSDVSREPVTIRSDDIYAVKLKVLHVLARKPKYP